MTSLGRADGEWLKSRESYVPPIPSPLRRQGPNWQAGQYRNLGASFAAHGFTRHGAGQYVDYDNPIIHTNTIESAFSIFKRGMKGIYQHCQKKHLHRYVAEFEFRYNNREKLGCNDQDRSVAAIKGIVGKRLTYVQ